MIHKKSCECDEIINKHIKIKHSLAFVDKLLSNIENLALNQITLEHQSEQIIFISDLSSVAVGKKRLEIMAKHNRKLLISNILKKKL